MTKLEFILYEHISLKQCDPQTVASAQIEKWTIPFVPWYTKKIFWEGFERGWALAGIVEWAIFGFVDN